MNYLNRDQDLHADLWQAFTHHASKATLALSRARVARVKGNRAQACARLDMAIAETQEAIMWHRILNVKF